MNEFKNEERTGLLKDDDIDKITNSAFDIENNDNNIRNNQYLVPEFINKQMTIYEKSKIFRIFCFWTLICVDYDNHKISNISQNDLEVYYNLRNFACHLYDEKNNKHEESLKILHINCLKSELNENLRNSEWKLIGFQVIKIILI